METNELTNARSGVDEKRLVRRLILPVKGCWYHLINTGEKVFEYRLRNEYWKKRLEGREYDEVEITLGYPKRGDMTRRLRFQWKGYELRTITSPEWGNIPQRVYAIDLRSPNRVDHLTP